MVDAGQDPQRNSFADLDRRAAVDVQVDAAPTDFGR